MMTKEQFNAKLLEIYPRDCRYALFESGAEAGYDILVGEMKSEIHKAWQRGKEEGFELGKLTDPLGSKEN